MVFTCGDPVFAPRSHLAPILACGEPAPSQITVRPHPRALRFAQSIQHLLPTRARAVARSALARAVHAASAHRRMRWTYNMDSNNAAEVLGLDGLGLSDEVLAAVRHLGYTEPTPVQAAAMPRCSLAAISLPLRRRARVKLAGVPLPTMCRLGHVAPRGERRRRARGRGPLMSW